MKKPILAKLSVALNFLKQADLKNAQLELNRLLNDDLESEEIDYALLGVNYWLKNFEKTKQISNPMEQGEFMISQWKAFLSHIEKQGEIREPIIYALKRAVFIIALKFYSVLFKEEKEPEHAEPYRKVGLCRKALGDYDKALEFLKYAYTLDKTSSAIVAELADCYACYGETKLAKVFFREAFFINPEGIELEFLESEIILRLIQRVKDLGIEEEFVVEWIPIYGLLDGVFNVKRELRSVEFGQLKQKIFLLDCELKEKQGTQREKLVPRLINYYFWLIDHYVSVNEDKTKIDDILLRIKVLDKNIYDCYTK